MEYTRNYCNFANNSTSYHNKAICRRIHSCRLSSERLLFSRIGVRKTPHALPSVRAGLAKERQRQRKEGKERGFPLRTEAHGGNPTKKEAATYSPTLHRSTIGAGGLNFSVRNGKRWDPAAIAAMNGEAAGTGCKTASPRQPTEGARRETKTRKNKPQELPTAGRTARPGATKASGN